MGTDLRAHAVLQRRDDLAARGVILRVGAEDEGDIEREAHGIALNLHIAFLHDVEERDLDFASEVRQLVDGEDAAIGARQQAIVHGELVREIGAGARGLDGIEIADQVGDRDIRRRQLLDVALVAGHPRDGSGVAAFGNQVARVLRDGR